MGASGPLQVHPITLPLPCQPRRPLIGLCVPPGTFPCGGTPITGGAPAGSSHFHTQMATLWGGGRKSPRSQQMRQEAPISTRHSRFPSIFCSRNICSTATTTSNILLQFHTCHTCHTVFSNPPSFLCGAWQGGALWHFPAPEGSAGIAIL